jgi:hypothetical protein
MNIKSALLGAAIATLLLLAVGFDRPAAKVTATIYEDSTTVQYIVYSDGKGGLGITPRLYFDGRLVTGSGMGFGR